MRYYELHEKAYKQLKEEERDSWDEFLGQTDQFEAFGFRGFLEIALPKLMIDSSPPMALEIGCGTGPGSCFLAKLIPKQILLQ